MKILNLLVIMRVIKCIVDAKNNKLGNEGGTPIVMVCGGWCLTEYSASVRMGRSFGLHLIWLTDKFSAFTLRAFLGN